MTIAFMYGTDKSFKTPYFSANVAAAERPVMPLAHPRLLVVSDFDHTLSRNDCGEQVATNHGFSAKEFYEQAEAIGKRDPTIERGGEFAGLVIEHPKFARLTEQSLLRAADKVVLKDNVGPMVAQVNRGFGGYAANFFVVSAGPQPTVRKALAKVGVASQDVIGSRFSFDAAGKPQTLVHVSAGEGKVDIIKDLQHLFGVPGEHLVYFGDGSSDVGAMRYVRTVGGYNVAVEDHPALRPYRDELLPKSDDAMDFLGAIGRRVEALASPLNGAKAA